MPPFAANQDIEELQHEELHLRARRPGGADRHGHGPARPRSPPDIKDYEFQLIDQTVKKGDAESSRFASSISPTASPFPDAVIFATRLDMAPDGMQEMRPR